MSTPTSSTTRPPAATTALTSCQYRRWLSSIFGSRNCLLSSTSTTPTRSIISASTAPSSILTSTVVDRARSPSTLSPTPSPSLNVSTKGTCGAAVSQTHIGSKYGVCCRFAGKCGNGLHACGIRCQSKYGSYLCLDVGQAISIRRSSRKEEGDVCK